MSMGSSSTVKFGGIRMGSNPSATIFKFEAPVSSTSSATRLDALLLQTVEELLVAICVEYNFV